jgi:uncharacterized protein
LRHWVGRCIASADFHRAKVLQRLDHKYSDSPGGQGAESEEQPWQGLPKLRFSGPGPGDQSAQVVRQIFRLPGRLAYQFDRRQARRRPPASFCLQLRLQVQKDAAVAELTLSQRSAAWPKRHPTAFLASAAVVWWALYQALLPAAQALVGALPVERTSHLGGALEFFFYDTPKVLLLLTAVVFVMGMVNSYFTPEHTRKLLAGRTEGLANVMAASLGIVTPFCSCSAVPLFIGFVQAGVPLGVTFSFLISAPMVNEVALALLFGMFGWKIALLYMGLGLSVAIVAGWVIGRLRMEHYLEDWVRDMPRIQAADGQARMTLGERIEAGLASVREIVGKVWPYILVGIAIGGAIHGWVPQDFMASIMGKDAWWSVPLAVLIGVPMYTNAAGVIPIVQALLAKGAALGTVLAFMMSVIALSLPEMIILRKVLKVRLIVTFAGVVATGILIVGFVFNAVL